MPFRSEKQRKFLYAKKPAIAKRFAEHERRKRGRKKTLRDKRTTAQRFGI